MNPGEYKSVGQAGMSTVTRPHEAREAGGLHRHTQASVNYGFVPPIVKPKALLNTKLDHSDITGPPAETRVQERLPACGDGARCHPDTCDRRLTSLLVKSESGPARSANERAPAAVENENWMQTSWENCRGWLERLKPVSLVHSLILGRPECRDLSERPAIRGVDVVGWALEGRVHVTV